RPDPPGLPDRIRSSVHPQASTAAVRIDTEAHMRGGVERPDLVLERMPGMGLQRAWWQQLLPQPALVRVHGLKEHRLIVHGAGIKTARGRRIAFEVPRVDLDAPNRAACRKTNDRPVVARAAASFRL